MRKISSSCVAVLMLLAVPCGFAQTSAPKQEFRGAWIATVSNLDWPNTRGASPAVQQASLARLLDDLQAAGINAVMFQVRSEADAMYASSLEPWSRYLTGTQGQAPSPLWDPLAFAISEAHQRGMELHAWFNPFRTQSGSRSFTSPEHVAAEHPEWELQVGSARLLNPGIPAVRSYIIDVVADIVARYDIDGIHYDDYFYPYPPNEIGLEDDATFRQHNPQNLSSRADWRRSNINQFVKGVYERVKAIKPWVKVGASPFGIWRSGTPAGIVGLSSYDVIYADAVNWMEQGWVDYLAPQLYWAFGGGQDYETLALWWRDQRNDRHVYPGVIFKSSYNTSELPRQVSLNRSVDGIDGTIFFRADNLQTNTLGFAQHLREEWHPNLALTPSMPWLNMAEPETPTALTATQSGNEVTLSWFAEAGWGADPSRFAIYRTQSATPPNPDALVADAANLVAITWETTFTDQPPAGTGPYHYVLTSVSANSVESRPSDAVTVEGRAVATEASELPAAVTIAQNYPNPFNPVTEIEYTLPASQVVELVVSDVLGRRVATLTRGMQPAGVHRVTWAGADSRGSAVASGTYIYTLRTQDQQVSRTMVLLK
ncbi:MAG: family 10 glycosylhydrolase [Bacteroidota bacterium]